jgi:molecular chaperone GrpE
MMRNQKGEHRSRTIPIRFLDEEDERESRKAAIGDEASDEGREPSAEDIGRESSYEDETEVQRRIDRGGEDGTEMGRNRADDSDVAGGPQRGEMPEHREDQNKSNPGGSGSHSGPAAGSGASQATQGTEPGVQATGPMMAELVATRAELKRVETERAELQDRLMRRQAEFDNYRKRVDRERGETFNRMLGDVARKLLPVLDNLRRALDAEASMKANESEEFRHFLDGVELIYKQLNDVLEGLGVEPVPAVGQPFDPHVHEAVVTEQTEEFEPDTVIQELVRGYRLGDKLLRPAVVKVATK